MVQVSVILSAKFDPEDGGVFYPGQKCSVPGILQGFKTAHSRGLLPPGVVYNVTVRDSGCDGQYGIKAFTDARVDGANVLFGPSCDYSLGNYLNCLFLVTPDSSRSSTTSLVWDFTGISSKGSRGHD